ncbi:toll/interleukin-1 receptor domain-containing protein [Bacillus infantis]|uniref:Toll/interleukin-1 receptor domain-containing protein n=1 Tax=Bacillus infantis TaxID=324767 RepID=A0A5D4RNA7_9BACI|nr:toll/interleukin-1 receptor domain-containing protein [Bacillus infantis]TYS51234.1 toll/interleukin-1 receptor domain-containing protein [Bacillus infantis]
MRPTGKNLADPQIYKSAYFEASYAKRACIFLSHTRLDKDHVIKVGDYIMQSGFDIYLDIYDKELQRAADLGDHQAITQCLEKGIVNSTHMLCCLSEKTKHSWWVPYEMGYGKSKEHGIATLLLKDVNLEDIPSYLYISDVIKGIKSLNAYLHKLSQETESLLEKYAQNDIASPNTIKEFASPHPLDNYLKWRE